MRKFSIGVATTKNHVVLIRKTKPDWQAGRYNFVGGKVEPGESYALCMVREFEEEAGIKTSIDSWKYVGYMQRPNDFMCCIYHQENEEFLNVKTMTEEKIVLQTKKTFLHDAVNIPELYMSNVGWIYMFTQSEDFNKWNCTMHLDFDAEESGN
jgi:8-oxo-dGTP pyrophosphatase MutT (NUDIX family)